MGRLPTGLVFSLFVAAVCLGLLLTLVNLDRAGGPPLELLVHGSAALCLVWGVVSFVASWRYPKFCAADIGRDLLAVLQIAMILTGLMVVILMTYTATTEVILRAAWLKDYPTQWRVHIWRSGLLDLACIAGATVLAWTRWRDPQLVTVCFWTLVLAGLWLTLQIPAYQIIHTGPGWSYQEMTSWAVPFLVWNSVLIASFSVGESLRYRIRAARAWPNRLDDLIRRRRPWPGFHYSVGIIAVVLLLIACIHITSPWVGPAGVLAAIALLGMVNRRWDESLADVAIGLLTLGIVSFPLAWLPMPRWPTAAFYLELFNRLVLGLAVMNVFWHWVAGVWEQQLDHGRAWTTAGRLIRIVQRLGYLCAATAVLVALQLAVWPRLVNDVPGLDNSRWRWTWGLIAMGLLTVGLVWATRKTRKPTLAYLTFFAIAAAVTFALIRLGDAPVVQWFALHWPLLTPPVAALCVILAAVAVHKAGWSPFAGPLLTVGLLVLPVAGPVCTKLIDPVGMPHWTLAAVLAMLIPVYLFTAMWFRNGTWLWAAGACLGLAVWLRM